MENTEINVNNNNVNSNITNNKNLVRQTAYKLWISDLFNGVFIKGQQEFEASYVAVRGLNVSRVNLIGVVITANIQEGFSSIVVDDGSGSIALRAWKEDVSKLAGFDIGNLVLVVGKVKSFNNSIYIIPDFVRKLENVDWFMYRKLELGKKFGKPVKLEVPTNTAPVVDDYIPGTDLEEQDVNYVAVQEEKVGPNISEEVSKGVNGNPTAVINSLISSEDKGEGVDIALVIAKSGLSENIAQKVIDELIRGGEVFEIRPGFVRSLI